MRAFLESVNTYLEHVLDVVLDHRGCLIGSLVALVVLAIVLVIGLIAYGLHSPRPALCAGP